MARKKSTSTNPVLCLKPNQFPGARLGQPQWDKKDPTPEVVTTNTTTDAEEPSEAPSVNDAAPGTLEYYQRRFAES